MLLGFYPIKDASFEREGNFLYKQKDNFDYNRFNVKSILSNDFAL